jgi:hypothetical protein
MDGPNESRGTWVHPKVAINIAQWISPKFSVQVSEWIYQLLTTGSVKLERPIKKLTNLTEMDIEAEQIENQLSYEEHTTDIVLYCAYIGKGLAKVGYSDGQFVKRNLKHQNSESQFPQWRLLKIFPISGRPVEKQTHEFLFPHREDFNKQKEIYKVSGKLGDFLVKIEKFLEVNDTKMALRKCQEKCYMLEGENTKLKLENMQLRLELAQK